MKTNTLKQIKSAINTEKLVLREKYGVTKIGIFGSYSFGDFKKNSDVDILVEFKEPISLFKFMKLEDYLSCKLGKKVDLVSKNGIKKYIKKDILSSTVYA